MQRSYTIVRLNEETTILDLGHLLRSHHQVKIFAHRRASVDLFRARREMLHDEPKSFPERELKCGVTQRIEFMTKN